MIPARLRWIILIAGLLLVVSLALIFILRHKNISKAQSLDQTREELRQTDEMCENLEDQLRQAMKMEAVGRLAGGIAHDFNNQLTIILNYVDLALEQIGDDQSIREELVEIGNAGARAVRLTSQLLAFSRKQVLESKAINLNDTVKSLENMLCRILGEDISLRLKTASDLDFTLADPGQMEQIVMNLVVNARDAMPDGGVLTIETANIVFDEVSAEQHIGMKPGTFVMMAVTDNGLGMDDETRLRVFEPFFTTKEKGKGTGLGLALVYGTVKQSGGHIWVYSQLGIGTTFKIYLPRYKSDVVEDAVSSAVSVETSGAETILLVEDEEAIRNPAYRILTESGYRVMAAGDGAEALEIISEYGSEIDLLLTDVIMPRKGGLALARELGRIAPDISVIYHGLFMARRHEHAEIGLATRRGVQDGVSVHGRT